MATASLLSRLRRSRRLSLLLFAGSLIALVIAATWFIAARTGLARSYDQLSNRNQLLAQAQMAQQEAQLKVESARSAQQVMDRLSALGLQPEGWGERMINLRSTQLSRDESAALLAGIAAGPDRLFGAEAFELSVTNPAEGLFHLPVLVDERIPAPLQVTLRGSLLFRTGPADDNGIASTTGASQP